ncbi:MAG: diadenylate cyclase CdaA [Clostridia bacterium]|nr:diadenylate cyclase CdaA [Clostridia bacterium]
MGNIFDDFVQLVQGSELSNYFDTLMAYPLRIVLAIIDLIIVGFILFKVYSILKNTRAIQLIKGIIVLLIANQLSAWLSLNILHLLLNTVLQYGILLVIVVFQPELRKALEQVGNTSIKKWFEFDEDNSDLTCVTEVVKAAKAMSATKTGMLVVFERQTSLGEIAHTGVELNSVVSAELLINIFVKDTPLHDGAVIIKNNKIQAASCILPLTDKESLDRVFGTRHRAAIGVSEVTDSVVVVVSEETGFISLACEGKISRNLSPEQLEKELFTRLEKTRQRPKMPFAKISKEK